MTRLSSSFVRDRELLLVEAEVVGREPTPALAAELLEHYQDGRIKLHVARTCSHLRRAHPLLFLEGAYRPVAAGEHVVAFERAHNGQRLLCVVPRLTTTLSTTAWPVGEVWGEAVLDAGPPTSWRNLFTGENIDGGPLAVRELMATFPIAWLLSSG